MLRKGRKKQRRRKWRGVSCRGDCHSFFFFFLRGQAALKCEEEKSPSRTMRAKINK